MVIKVAQCNIRSLNTSGKIIEDLCKLQNIGILSLTEIWHPEVSQLKFLHTWLWNTSIRVNREGGGAATIINPMIKSYPRKDLNNPLLEAVWCEIYVENRKGACQMDRLSQEGSPCPRVEGQGRLGW